MSINEFIEEYKSKLDLDIQALSELVRYAENNANNAAGHPDSLDYTREARRLKSKLEGIRLARNQFNDLVRTLL